MLDFTKTKKNVQTQDETANMFLNIKDIQKGFLYTIDGFVLSYLKIFPKNLKLMSKEDQMLHAQKLASELVSERKPLKIYLTNRPLDVTAMNDYQANLCDNEKDNQKQFLIQCRKNSLYSLASTGQSLEGEVFIIIWERDSDYVEDALTKRINELSLKLTNAGYQTEVLEEKGIIQLCNSYTNPSTAYSEGTYYLESPMKLI